MIYFEDGKKRFHVEQDVFPMNPREEFCDFNVGTLILYWNRLSIGDVHFNSASEIFDYIVNMVKELPAKDVIDFADRNEIPRPLVGDDEEIAEDIAEVLTLGRLIEILEEHDYVFLPVYGYEHSGFTISCSNTYPYSDRWDGGQAGFIYTDMETVDCGTEDWRKTAIEILKSEVATYDQYITGNVYGFIVDEKIDDEWEENVESCWGFFSDKWGKDLEEEIFLDYFGDIPREAKDA